MEISAIKWNIQVGDLFFDLNVYDMTATVSRDRDDEYDRLTSVVIPSIISFNGDDYRVTGVALGAFGGRRNLKKITIPETVKEIGIRAFGGCTNLREVIGMNESIKLGVSAFIDCPLSIIQK